MSPEYLVSINDENTQQFEEAVIRLNGKVLGVKSTTIERAEAVQAIWAKDSSKARGCLDKFRAFLRNSPDEALPVVESFGLDIFSYRQDPSIDVAALAQSMVSTVELSLPDEYPADRVLVTQSITKGEIVCKNLLGYVHPKHILLIFDRYGLTGEGTMSFSELAKKYETSSANVFTKVHTGLRGFRHSFVIRKK